MSDEIEYFSPAWNDGYREGLNDREPDHARMKSDPNYFDGWVTGWAEIDCPKEYRHMLKDNEIEEEMDMEMEKRPIHYAAPEEAMAAAKRVMAKDSETLLLLAAIERAEREGFVEVKRSN